MPDGDIGAAALPRELGEQQAEQDILAERDIGPGRRGPLDLFRRRGRFRGLVGPGLNRGRRFSVFSRIRRRGQSGAGRAKENRQHGRQITQQLDFCHALTWCVWAKIMDSTMTGRAFGRGQAKSDAARYYPVHFSACIL